MQLYCRTKERHLPYGIRLRYLPPDTSEHTLALSDFSSWCRKFYLFCFTFFTYL